MILVNPYENPSINLSSQLDNCKGLRLFSADENQFSSRIAGFISFSSIDTQFIDDQIDFSMRLSIEFSFIYGIEKDNTLIIQDVDENTESEVLEKAVEDRLVGIKEKRGEKETIKLAKQIPTNIQLITYRNEESTQTLDPTKVRFEILTSKETKWVIAKIKAQIIYLQTLHPKEEKQEKIIKNLMNFLAVLESKKIDNQDQDYEVRHKFSIQIKSSIKGSSVSSICYCFEKFIQNRKEQDRQETIDLKIRIITIITIEIEENKEDIKKEETNKDQVKKIALDVNLKCNEVIKNIF